MLSTKLKQKRPEGHSKDKALILNRMYNSKFTEQAHSCANKGILCFLPITFAFVARVLDCLRVSGCCGEN